MSLIYQKYLQITVIVKPYIIPFLSNFMDFVPEKSSAKIAWPYQAEIYCWMLIAG